MTTETVIDATEASFQTDVLDRSNEVPVVVDFWAEWCGPCRVLGPVLEQLAEEYGDAVQLVKIDTDSNPQVAARYGIRSIPAVKAFRDGDWSTSSSAPYRSLRSASSSTSSDPAKQTRSPPKATRPSEPATSKRHEHGSRQRSRPARTTSTVCSVCPSCS